MVDIAGCYPKVVFEMSIPEEIIIVKSVHGKRKYRKKATEPDGDSDEEARQLIDEAENEMDSETNLSAGTVIVLNTSRYTVNAFRCFLLYCTFL